MRTLLLIGGTGVLSSAVAAEARSLGFAVTMINRGMRDIPHDVELIRTNNKNYKFIADKLAGRQFEAVIDFLCYTPQELNDSFTLYSEFTSQYIFISSCSVYDTSDEIVHTEDSKKVTSTWQYSIDKWNCEQLLDKLSAKTICQYTIVRPCLTYGDTRIPYALVPQFRKHWTFIERIKSGKPIITLNQASNRWSVMRVEDFAVGVVGLIGNDRAYNEAFNICGDEAPTGEMILNAVSKKISSEIITIDVAPAFLASHSDPYFAGEILGGRAANLVCSNEKIKSIVPSFRQRIGLQDGVSRTIDAYVSQSYQLGIDWDYDAFTDKVISLWRKKERIQNNYNLNFVNYLGSASLYDRYTYWRRRNQGRLDERIVALGSTLANSCLDMILKRK